MQQRALHLAASSPPVAALLVALGLFLALCWVPVPVPVAAAVPCRFAPLFDAERLFRDEAVQDQFLRAVFAREGRFIQNNPCAPATAAATSREEEGARPGEEEEEDGMNIAPDLTNIGLHAKTGMTLDGHRWTVAGGLPLGEPHLFTAASKESLHLSLLALALQGDPYASLFLSPDDASQAVSVALAHLSLKVNTLDRFFETYPGFAGFLPWVYVSDEGLTPTSDFNSSTPSLDNGQMFWGAYAVAHALQQHHAHVPHAPLLLDFDTPSDELYRAKATTLAQRWAAVWQRMAANALIVFYDAFTNSTMGQFRTVSVIVDRTKRIDPTDSPLQAARNYHNTPGATQPYLNDPYEGELFTNMAYLLSDWQWTGASPASVWLYKRGMLEAVDLVVPDPARPGTNATRRITVERGFWHSGHEKWKYWLNPYTESSWSKRILAQGERARTWFSALHRLPGGFASAAGMADTDAADTGYHSDCGIAALAFEPVSNRDIVTPYAWAALSLVSRPHALAWFHNYLQAPRAQTCFGVLEALNRTGAGFAPLSTWDTKVTSLVAFTGGIGGIIADALASVPVDLTKPDAPHANDAAVLGVPPPAPGSVTNALQLLVWVLDVEWARVFGNGRLQGEDLPLQRPTAHFPTVLEPWPSCTQTSELCQCNAGRHADKRAQQQQQLALE